MFTRAKTNICYFSVTKNIFKPLKRIYNWIIPSGILLEFSSVAPGWSSDGSLNSVICTISPIAHLKHVIKFGPRIREKKYSDHVRVLLTDELKEWKENIKIVPSLVQLLMNFHILYVPHALHQLGTQFLSPGVLPPHLQNCYHRLFCIN